MQFALFKHLKTHNLVLPYNIVLSFYFTI
jgi:hypothetical protein